MLDTLMHRDAAGIAGWGWRGNEPARAFQRAADLEVRLVAFRSGTAEITTVRQRWAGC